MTTRLILAKPLEDGSLAVGLFNLDDLQHTIRATWQELGLTGTVPRRAIVWRQIDIGMCR